MAQFDKMIPFILHYEEGIPKSKLGLAPEQIYALVGEKVHIHPNDSGGYTKAGVILSTYRSYRASRGIQRTTVDDLRKMPYSEWREILKTMFWDRWKADEIKCEQVAIACVDWMWGSGVKSIEKVQALLGVKVDGIVGPQTLGAINGHPNQKLLFAKIQAARNAFHASIAKPGTKNSVFLRGWNRRVAAITWNGFDYDAK